MNLDLEGKCAIVTGGTRNLGRAVSSALLKEGANVIATYLQNAGAAREFESAIPAQQRSRLRILQLDASSNNACRTLCSRAESEFGKLDILVNNASANMSQPVDEITDADFDEILRNTLRSNIYMTRSAFVNMKKNGAGRIVNLSTTGVYTANPEELLYLCAKAGVEGATRAFARLGAPHGITVNAVAPHVIQSGMGLQTVSNDPSILSRIPLHRMGRVSELVSLVLFLASETCQYMTGQVINLSGGRLMN